MKEYKHLLATLEDGTLRLTINRPDSLNALNKETLRELALAVEEVYSQEDVLGVILTGAGAKAFVAGADIKEFSGLDYQKAMEMALYGQEIFREIERCPKPFIAAINGFALGGGCELAMACHMRVAVTTAKLGLPETNLGIIPGYGGTQRLARLAGRGKALELILTGDMVNASDALSIGLVNHVVDTQEELTTLAEKMMRKILKKAPVAIANAIKSVDAGLSEDDGYKAEAENFAHCAITEDFKEGTEAFIEKRAPIFKGK